MAFICHRRPLAIRDSERVQMSKARRDRLSNSGINDCVDYYYEKWQA